MSEVW